MKKVYALTMLQLILIHLYWTKMLLFKRNSTPDNYFNKNSRQDILDNITTDRPTTFFWVDYISLKSMKVFIRS